MRTEKEIDYEISLLKLKKELFSLNKQGYLSDDGVSSGIVYIDNLNNLAKETENNARSLDLLFSKANAKKYERLAMGLKNEN